MLSDHEGTKKILFKSNSKLFLLQREIAKLLSSIANINYFYIFVNTHPTDLKINSREANNSNNSTIII